MRSKLKTISAAVAAAALLAMFVYLFSVFARPSSMLSYLPEIPEQKQYVLVETHGKTFPTRLAAFLTDGPFALLHRGTSANALLSLADTASGTAVLIVNDGFSGAEVFTVYELPAKISAKLGKGELPDEWQKILPAAKIDRGQGKNSWEIRSVMLDAPIYYYTDKENVILASDRESFAQLAGQRSSNKKKIVWQQERSWPGHMEFGDGSALLGGEAPLKIQFAWRPLKNKDNAAPAGEAKWTVNGLTASAKAALLLSAKPTEWELGEYLVPSEPMLVSALNVPKLKEPPENWPFPLSAAANLAELLGLDQDNIKEITSGKTVLSLGGRNKLLWLTLPGFLVQFSGREMLVKELVSSFWENFFFDSAPKELDGWTYGGIISTPFSVVGAGRDGAALFGMVSPDSLQSGTLLSQYIPKKEKSIGWLIVDLPKLGESLGDMTKMMSLLTFEDGGDSDIAPSVLPSYRPNELDAGITHSFRRLLANLSRVTVIWERPTKGQLNWYPNSNP